MLRISTWSWSDQVDDASFRRWRPAARVTAALTAAHGARQPPVQSSVICRRCRGGAARSSGTGRPGGGHLRPSTSTSAATPCTSCATSTVTRAGTTTNGMSRRSSRAVSMATASSRRPTTAAYSSRCCDAISNCRRLVSIRSASCVTMLSFHFV